MEKRIEKLRKLMARRKLDAVWITSGENIRYFSGFTSVDGYVLVMRERCMLFTDFRYRIQAAEQVGERAELLEINRTSDLELFIRILNESGCKNVGFEENAVSAGVFTKLKKQPFRWKPLSGQIDAQRLVKDKAEIRFLRDAQILADKAYVELLNRIKPGMTEKEVAAELNYICALLGSEGPSFDPIIGSGPNGAMCHAIPSERKLGRGDLVVVDFGCVVNGYHSDMTRTFGIGKLDEELIRIYNIVREAQKRCLDALKPGLSGKALDAIARDYIAQQGYGECFGHGLGHGFGLLIHEAPSASAASEDTFKAGMTITVEPGIYLPGKGGVRIEDCCVLTRNGHLNLVSAGTELVIL